MHFTKIMHAKPLDLYSTSTCSVIEPSIPHHYILMSAKDEP